MAKLGTVEAHCPACGTAVTVPVEVESLSFAGHAAAGEVYLRARFTVDSAPITHRCLIAGRPVTTQKG